MSEHQAAIYNGAAEMIAARFHEAYERLAPEFGYATREASAVPWPEVPEANRQLMTAVVSELMFVQRCIMPPFPGPYAPSQLRTWRCEHCTVEAQVVCEDRQCHAHAAATHWNAALSRLQDQAIHTAGDIAGLARIAADCEIVRAALSASRADGAQTIERDYLAWHLKRALATVMPLPPEGSTKNETTSEQAILRRFFGNGALVGDDTLEALAQAAIEWALTTDLPTLVARAKPVKGGAESRAFLRTMNVPSTEEEAAQRSTEDTPRQP